MKTVLLVDDEVLIRETLAFSFEREDWKVYEAGNGQEALALLEQMKFDVMITDVRMPVLDGIGLLQSLQTMPQRCSVIFLMTGFAGTSEIEMKKLGVKAVFHKPIDIETIQKECEKYLKRV